MALNFLNQESLPNGLPVWHFEDPTDKARFSTLDPGQAFTLGAPTPSDMMNPNPQAAAPAPLPDLRLAQNAPSPQQVETALTGAPATATDAPTGFATAPELAASTARGPAPTAAAPSTGYTAETLGSQPAAPAAQQPAAPTPLTVEQLIPNQPGVVSADSLDPRYIAGTAGGYTATGRTTKGVAEEDKKTLQQQAEDLYTSQLATAEAENVAKRDSMLLESSERQLRMGEVERERQAQVALATKQEEEKQATLKRIADDEQAVTSRHPSMKNVWKSGGTVGVAALFAGLGELGAGLTRSGRNTALDMINRAVDQNLNEQAAAIASDKDALNGRKNAYAMYLADGHDPKFARLAAQNLALKLEEDRLLDASVQKSLNAQGVEYMSTVDGLKAKRLQVLTDLAKLTEVSQAEKYTAPRAGGVETEEQALARTLRTAKMSSELGELQGSRLTATERAGVVKDRSAAQATATPKPLKDRVTGFADDMQKEGIPARVGIVNGVLGALEAVKADESVWLKGIGGLSNLVEEGGLAENLLDPKARQLRRELTNMKDLLVTRKRTGAGMSGQEEQLYEYLVKGNRTVMSDLSEAEAAIKTMARDVDMDVKNLAVKHGDDAGEEYFKRLKGSSVQGATTGKPIAFKPDED